MTSFKKYYQFIALFACLLCFYKVQATVYTVNTKTDLQNRMSAALPGDTVIVENGTYNWDLINFTNSNGSSSSSAIVLRAQTISGVVFTGTTKLQFKGTNIVVNGFKFANGNAGTSAVIRLGTSSTNVSNYCRITNVTIDNYNSDSATENEWIGLYGIRNRIDHCTFINKSNARATVVVWYSSTTYPNPALSTYHRIDSNYFKGRGYLGDNGGETIRVGDSNSSRTDGNNTIEYNLFEDCVQTEPEIISNKSDFNIYRYNTFRNSKGGLTLRHGRYCSVYGNFFLVSDNTVTEAYGIRVIDKGHKIFNNYIEAVNGNSAGGTSQLRAPINLYNGLSTDTTDAAAASGYFPADSCLIAFNTIVNAKGGGGIILGGTGGGSIQPTGIMLANNLVRMATGTALYKNPANTALTFSSEGNIYDAPSGLGITTNGWQNTALTFGARDNGILIAPSSAVQDKAVNSSSYTILQGLDAQGQTRSSVYDVGCDELNGSGVQLMRPLTSADVGAGTSASLPVSLLNFNANAADGAVMLRWKVTNELKFSRYEIEISNNGSNYHYLSTVSAKDAGTIVNEYFYKHVTPAIGRNFYRLKLIDKDGSYTYSPVREVNLSVNAGIKVYPNPASSFINVSSEAIKVLSITITDALGKVQKKINIDTGNNNVIHILLTGLAQGSYVLQAKDEHNKAYNYLFTKTQ